VLISLAVTAGILLFVVRPAFHDSTTAVQRSVDRATKTAQQQLDAADADASESSTGDELAPATLAQRVEAITGEIGADAKLLEFVVNPSHGGSVQYQKTADSAAGFQWATAQGNELEPVTVKLSGDGNLSDNVFPISKLDPEVPAALIQKLETQEPGFELSTATLRLNPVDGALQWSLPGETESRTGIVFQASRDGSRLKRIG